MKKIRLNVANLDGTEILSREQQKFVFGGSTGSSVTYHSCTNPSGGPYCGTANGLVCKKSDGKAGKCFSPQATTLCHCG